MLDPGFGSPPCINVKNDYIRSLSLKQKPDIFFYLLHKLPISTKKEKGPKAVTILQVIAQGLFYSSCSYLEAVTTTIAILQIPAC